MIGHITRMIVGAALVVGVGMTSAASVGAKDDSCNRGNHEAVWALEDVPMHNLDSGSEWGKTVSEWRMDTSGSGVSDGVHFQKDMWCDT
jgi:hypothetical protein